MQQGEIVEEGDHDSLMKAQGIYFDLIKQQNLCQFEEEEEEELQLEQNEITKLMSGDETNNDLIEQVHHKKTIDSATQSVISAVYGMKNSLAGYKLHENDDEKKIAIKERKKNTTVDILQMNKPEWIFIAIGCIAASINGAREPHRLEFCNDFTIRRNLLPVIFID
ncbi:unnamed protein product [Rotaria sp. Silwood2]|nr:unnamed protein product [Rotaria sp. Silwood2]